MNYYNEFDPFAAAWLRNLIAAGLIPAGDVDTRSITEVKPDDIRKYTQCHFFAGIGGWSEALRLAGWPADRPVWTGSCPCQPFSSAGAQKGKTDERHLWPIWFNLIRECRPATIFGEQVSSAIAHGWLDDVYQGLEAEGYAVGSAVLPACSVGAPHKRDRLWFVADAGNGRRSEPGEGKIQQQGGAKTFGTGEALANSENSEPQNTLPTRSGRDGLAGHDGYVAHSSDSGRNQGRERIPATRSDGLVGNDGPVADPIEQRSQGHAWNVKDGDQPGRLCSEQSRSAWQSGIWIDCPDGKQRLIEPSIRLLAHGVQNRVGKLRGYGNAIVPQVAAKFIEATM